jgi:predicted dehydrogenase
MEFRGRGKEDGRGGGEDLWVLGTHVLNLINTLGGEPRWSFGRVLNQGQPVGPDDVREGAEGIGPLAGDEVHALYGLDGGATAHFDSIRDAGGKRSRFGFWVYGTEGVIRMTTGYLPETYILDDPLWSPGRSGKRWLPVTSAGVDQPEPLTDGGLHAGNVLAVKDLIAAIEENREPVSNITEARTAVEMIAAVFESHRTGGLVALPLENRQNPLTLPFPQ